MSWRLSDLLSLNLDPHVPGQAQSNKIGMGEGEKRTAVHPAA
jgi:hypothetical protein